MENRRVVLLKLLKELTKTQLSIFKFYAQSHIPQGLLDEADTREKLANLLAESLGTNCGAITISILKKVPRNDLAQAFQPRLT